MRIKQLIVLLFLGCVLSCPAQTKKAINQARDWVKAGTNLHKADSTMYALLADSANRSNVKIWLTMFDALRKQYAQGNEKLYLKQKYDTAQLFLTTVRMFKVMEEFDSIDALPDKKGRIQPEYRKDNAEWLNTVRPNLYNGGLFFIRKQKFSTAYALLDTYIDCINQPLFTAYKYQEHDKLLSRAAYWAVYSAYKMGDVKKVLHHTYWAMKDTLHTQMMLQYLAETYKLDGDTARYVVTLHEGFDKYPRSLFFFSHLIEYYSEQKAWDKALALTDVALQADSTNTGFILTKSTVLLNVGRYSDAFALSKPLAQAGDSIPEAVLNAGLAKFNEGVMIEKQNMGSEKKRRQALNNYKEALPYLERYRKRCPENKDKWGLPLYTIYLNLNMGREFDEIEKILKQ